jgi:muramoyltetrapeptide carboxypeptidase
MNFKKEEYVVPAFLRQGDTIGVIAPARKISEAELLGAVNWFEEQGFKVKFAANLFKTNNQFSGTDEERAADLMQMFTDPEVKAIICARGGYGSVRMLPYLNANVIKANPKWVVGYSDITVLHSYLHSECRMQTLHATMSVNFSSEKEQFTSWQKMLEVLMGRRFSFETEGNSLNRQGVASGVIVGGNLSVLYSLRGTFADIDTHGKILFIEDLDEYLYHVDRMMMNLKLGGKLSCLNGLIVGGLSDMKDNAIPFGMSACEIIADAVKEYDYPVIFDFPAGHQTANYPLLFGSAAEMQVAEIGKVVF